MEAMSVDKRTDVAEKSLQRMLEWIRTIDTKGQIVLGLDLALIGSIVAVWPSDKAFRGFLAIASIVAGGLVVSSIAYSLSAFFPQLRRTLTRNQSPPSSFIFFGAIAASSEDDYIKRMTEQTQEGYHLDLLHQVHRNAVIVNRKYVRVKWAILQQGLAIAPWIYMFLCHNKLV